MLTLHNDRLRLVILPNVGAAFARFDMLLANGTSLPVFRPAPPGATDPDQMACYPLLPWSNRIQHGFPWHGEHVTLAPNVSGEPYPLHGDGWQRSWMVQSASATDALLTLESAWQPPFEYGASMRCTLSADALEVGIAITHRGKRSAPYGFGLHPWLLRTPDVLLHAPAAGVFGEAVDHLPTDWSSIETRPEWDFHSPHPLPEGGINNLFTGWAGSAVITWPSRGMRLTIETTPALPYYIIYSPSSNSSFFCFEPVSHTIDAHNTPSPVQAGLRVLRRSESIQATWRFRPVVEPTDHGYSSHWHW